MLYTWLGDRYGEERVFKDVDTIEVGLDFGEAIDRVVDASEVMLVVIGERWVTDRSGRRRLEEPDDYVRMEIHAGLERNIRVIPILVGGATMPGSADLPEPLSALARRQAFELNDARLRADREELLWRLDRVMQERATRDAATEATSARPPGQPSPPPPASHPTAVQPPVQHPPAHVEPKAAEPEERVRTLRRWGWGLAVGSLVIPFLALGAVVFGGLVISRGQGRSTRAGVAIILVAVLLALLSISFWASLDEA